MLRKILYLIKMCKLLECLCLSSRDCESSPGSTVGGVLILLLVVFFSLHLLVSELKTE